MGFDKLLAKIGEKPVIVHALRAFQETDSVTAIVVVGREKRLADLRKAIADEQLGKVTAVIAGGERRQDSVRIGLAAVGAEARHVAIHDAARPLVTPQQIESVYQLCLQHGAAALAEPVTDTLKRADEECCVCGSVDRNGLFAMQTPQVFERELIERAYAAVAGNNISITDEVSAVEHVGHKIVIVPNETANFKITYPADLPMAEFVLRSRHNG
jgi:2-C-methyl-D-erythritol 4-phosphate cytidylyltransferase